jgi:hypothetical protein
VVVAVGYVPSFNSNGLLFGLFDIDPIDDALHLASAAWAAIAAYTSRKQAIIFFKIFGILYALDGVLGLFFGRGYLDLGLFLNGPLSLDLMTKIGANTPHILIGGLAIYLGFCYGAQSKATSRAKK